MSEHKKIYSKLAVAMSNSIEIMQKALQEAQEIDISKEDTENNLFKSLYFYGTEKTRKALSKRGLFFIMQIILVIC